LKAIHEACWHYDLADIIASDQSAKTIQLPKEYNPKPPFDCGTPDKAPKEILERKR